MLADWERAKYLWIELQLKEQEERDDEDMVTNVAYISSTHQILTKDNVAYKLYSGLVPAAVDKVAFNRECSR